MTAHLPKNQNRSTRSITLSSGPIPMSNWNSYSNVRFQIACHNMRGTSMLSTNPPTPTGVLGGSPNKMRNGSFSIRYSRSGRSVCSVSGYRLSVRENGIGEMYDILRILQTQAW